VRRLKLVKGCKCRMEEEEEVFNILFFVTGARGGAVG
jgi:hypothetical protein